MFKDNRFDDFSTLTLEESTKYDKKLKSKDVTPKHVIQIGESIYPNEKEFELNTPQTYQRLEGEDFLLEVEYFYTSKDSSIKVILYQWNFYHTEDQKVRELTDTEIKKKYEKFDKKFNYLRTKLTKKLGEPSDIEINSKNSEINFRDGIKWIGDNNPKAYLFMFGNNNNQYRQIGLAIYSE